MSPYEVRCPLLVGCMRAHSLLQEPSDSTLSDFLIENQGKRCVVVLDVRAYMLGYVSSDLLHQEIEKVEDEKYLSSLLMPWELGTTIALAYRSCLRALCRTLFIRSGSKTR